MSGHRPPVQQSSAPPPPPPPGQGAPGLPPWQQQSSKYNIIILGLLNKMHVQSIFHLQFAFQRKMSAAWVISVYTFFIWWLTCILIRKYNVRSLEHNVWLGTSACFKCKKMRKMLSNYLILE